MEKSKIVANELILHETCFISLNLLLRKPTVTLFAKVEARVLSFEKGSTNITQISVIVNLNTLKSCIVKFSYIYNLSFNPIDRYMFCQVVYISAYTCGEKYCIRVYVDKQ